MCPVSKKEDSGGFLCETIHSFLVLLAGDFEFSSRQLSHLKEKRGRGKGFRGPLLLQNGVFRFFGVFITL